MHLKFLVYIYFLLNGLIVFDTYAHSIDENVFQLTGTNQQYGDLYINNDFISIYEDRLNSETENTIVNKRFHSLSLVNHKTFEHDNWIKFKVKNNTSSSKEWTLIHADPHAFHYKIFVLDTIKNTLVLLNEAGTGISFHKRIKPFHSFSEDLKFAPYETKIFYAYYKKGAYYNFKYFFQTPRFAIDWELTEYAYIGLFYGFMVFALLFSVISFITLKQRIYLFYSVYLISILFYIGHHNLLTFQFLWPDKPIINTFAQHGKGLFLILSFYFYVKYFFKSYAQQNLYFEKQIILSLLIYIIITIVDSFIYKNNLVFVGIAIPYLLLYASVFKSYRSGFGASKRFFIGFTILLIGFIIYFLMELNFITANVFTVYSLYFAFSLEVLFFTTALGLRYKYLEKEKADIVFRFNEQIQIHNLEKNKIVNDFTQKFDAKYFELKSNYEKAKLELLVAENEIRQLSETEGKAIIDGNVEEQIFMSKIIDVIDKNISNANLDRDFICVELGVSKSVLYRKLKDAHNLSINILIRNMRLRKSMEMLKTKKYAISDIYIEVGFSSLSYFTKTFKKEFGCNPSDILNDV